MLQNLRDAGGHATRDGERLRTGLLFRGDAPVRLDDAAQARLAGARPAHDRRPAPRPRARALGVRARLVRRAGRRAVADRRAAAPGQPAQRRARRLQPLGLRDARRDDRRDRRHARRARRAAGARPLHRRQGPHRPGRRPDPELARRAGRRRSPPTTRSAPSCCTRTTTRRSPSRRRRWASTCASAPTCSRRGRSGSSTRWTRCARRTAAPEAYLLAHGARPDDLERLRAALVEP